MTMRICEPFGPELRKGLWLYHILEPEPWSRVCARGRPWCKVCSPRVAVFWSAEAGKTGPPYVAELCLTACRSRWRNITGPKLRCTSTGAGGGGISQSDQKPPLPELYGAFEASAGGMGADMNDVMEKSLQQLETSLSEMDEVARTLALNTIRQLH